MKKEKVSYQSLLFVPIIVVGLPVLGAIIVLVPGLFMALIILLSVFFRIMGTVVVFLVTISPIWCIYHLVNRYSRTKSKAIEVGVLCWLISCVLPCAWVALVFTDIVTTSVPQKMIIWLWPIAITVVLPFGVLGLCIKYWLHNYKLKRVSSR